MINFYLVLLFIFIVLISLTFHEIGHFIFAKIFKIIVHEFSIGIGPKICSFKFKETTYSLRLLPIAAYVSLSSRKSQLLYKSIVMEYINDDKFNKVLANMSNKEQFKLVRNKGFSIAEFRSLLFYRDYRKYNNFLQKYPSLKTIDDISFLKNTLIIFGGVFMNLIIFLISFLFLKYVLNSPFDFLEELKLFFVNFWNTISFQKLEKNNSIDVNFENVFLVYLLLINMSLFILNIFPIPPLDGFKFISLGLEKILNKNIPESVDFFCGIIGIIFIVYVSIASVINLYL